LFRLRLTDEVFKSSRIGLSLSFTDLELVLQLTNLDHQVRLLLHEVVFRLGLDYTAVVPLLLLFLQHSDVILKVIDTCFSFTLMTLLLVSLPFGSLELTLHQLGFTLQSLDLLLSMIMLDIKLSDLGL